MADNFADKMKAIAGLKGSVESLNDVLSEMGELSKKALEINDAKALAGIKNLKKSTEELAAAEKRRNALMSQAAKLQKDQKNIENELKFSRNKNNHELIKQLDEITKKREETFEGIRKEQELHEEASEKIITARDKLIRKHDEEKAKLLEIEEAMREHFREHTLLGKSFGLLTSGVAKFAGGLTFGTLAVKAWDNHLKAAELRQNILIQNFRGFNDEVSKTTGTIGVLSEGLNVLGLESMGHALAATDKFSDAIAHAEGTAIRMGVPVEAVSDAMLKFSRVAGTSNPEALRSLTEGALAVSRTLGIDTASAVEFVQTRMDKFGGSSASALAALNLVREESEQINKTFGRTVVRGDDIVKTLQSISQESNVYAIDQRLVGSILRDNIARLQASGDSYDLARRKAEAFTKGVTGQAPEWMKILAGEDLTSAMLKSFNEGRFKEEFGEELDKASPGLSQKVRGILTNKSLGAYDKTRLIQELTAQTSVGINSINKQVLDLYRSSGNSLTVLAKQMNISYEEASGMVTQAEDLEKTMKRVDELQGLSLEKLREKVKKDYEGLQISKEFAEYLKNDKNAMQEFVRQQELANAAKAKTVQMTREEYTAKLNILKGQKTNIANLLEEAKFKRRNALTDEGRMAAQKEMDLYQSQLKSKKQEIADLGGKTWAQKKEEDKQKLKDEIQTLNEDLKAVKERGELDLRNSLRLAVSKLETAKEKGDAAEISEAQKEVNIAKIKLRHKEEVIDGQISELEQKIGAKTKEIEKIEQEPDENLQSMDETTKDLVAQFKAFAGITGKSFMAMVTEYSTLSNLTLLTGMSLALTGIFKRAGGIGNIEKLLMRHFGVKYKEQGLLGKIFRKKEPDIPDGGSGRGGKSKRKTPKGRKGGRTKVSKRGGGGKAGLAASLAPMLADAVGLGEIADLAGIVGDVAEAASTLSKGAAGAGAAGAGSGLLAMGGAAAIGGAIGVGIAKYAIDPLVTKYTQGTTKEGFTGDILERGMFRVGKGLNLISNESGVSEDTMKAAEMRLEEARKRKAAGIPPAQINPNLLQQPTAPTPPGGTTPVSANQQNANLTGSLGSINPDGSVSLKIVNFMDAFGGAAALAKRNIKAT